MKLALTINCWTDEDLMFAQQFGADQVMAQAVLPEGRTAWDARLLSALRNRVEKAGLALAGMDCLPVRLDRAIAGMAGRDEEIETVCRFMRDAGAAGIPLVGCRWGVDEKGPVRQPTGRGGAAVAVHQAELQPGGAGWEIFLCFLERVVPVAEEGGVKLACGPGNSLLGRIEDLQRLVEEVPSSCLGIDFWQGAVALMPGVDLAGAIRWFGGRQKLFLVTLGNSEAFLDEGDTRMLRSLRLYREAGFVGGLRPGPQPGMADDTEWGHKSQAFAIGYLRALLQVVENRKQEEMKR